MATNQQGQKLQIQQPDANTSVEIKYKIPYTPHKTLGHYKASGGQGFTQKQILKEIATRYAVRVMTSALTYTAACMYYYSCYCKLAGYVLGQSFFLREDLNEIEGDAICSFTSKMEYNRNMVHVIHEGPYQYG
eukprot:15346031-Ditylum_brightwellii.AAC.2